MYRGAVIAGSSLLKEIRMKRFMILFFKDIVSSSPT